MGKFAGRRCSLQSCHNMFLSLHIGKYFRPIFIIQWHGRRSVKWKTENGKKKVGKEGQEGQEGKEGQEGQEGKEGKEGQEG